MRASTNSVIELILFFNSSKKAQVKPIIRNNKIIMPKIKANDSASKLVSANNTSGFLN